MEIIRFKKSSFCEAGACVEVAVRPEAVIVRHSDNDGKIIIFKPDQWKSFIDGVKNNEFDVEV